MTWRWAGEQGGATKRLIQVEPTRASLCSTVFSATWDNEKSRPPSDPPSKTLCTAKQSNCGQLSTVACHGPSRSSRRLDRDGLPISPRRVQSATGYRNDVHLVIGCKGLCSGYRGCRKEEKGRGQYPMQWANLMPVRVRSLLLRIVISRDWEAICDGRARACSKHNTVRVASQNG